MPGGRFPPCLRPPDPPDPPPPPPPPLSEDDAASSTRPSVCACDCTQDIAMCALSLMTSPSWPVSCSWPVPGMTAASMYMMSPPTAVHDSPATIPGIKPLDRRSLLAPSYRGGPNTFSMSSRVTTGMPSGPMRDIAAAAGCSDRFEFDPPGGDARTTLLPPTPLLSDACAACTAAARHSDARHRCNPRTPASRV